MSMICRPKWPFLHMYGSHDMRHVDFRELTGSQRTPRVWGVTNNNSKKDKTCFYCKKKRHFKQECRLWKKMKNDHTGSSGKINVAEAQEKELQNLVAMVSEMQILMVTEVNIASVSNTNDWWYDLGATIHICNDKNQFKHYEVAA